MAKQSGRLSGLPLFFLHELWYNNLNKSTRPLEGTRGWIFVSQPRALSGNEKSGCQIGADQSPARLLTARTMRETRKPPVFRLEHRGVLYASASASFTVLQRQDTLCMNLLASS